MSESPRDRRSGKNQGLFEKVRKLAKNTENVKRFSRETLAHPHRGPVQNLLIRNDASMHHAMMVRAVSYTHLTLPTIYSV